METLTINRKKFIVIEQKEFDKLQLLAAQKTPSVKKISLHEGKRLPINSLINGQKKSNYS